VLTARIPRFLDSESLSGAVAKEVTVFTNDAANPAIQLTLRATSPSSTPPKRSPKSSPPTSSATGLAAFDGAPPEHHFCVTDAGTRFAKIGARFLGAEQLSLEWVDV
jgi:hypothetical protein